MRLPPSFYDGTNVLRPRDRTPRPRRLPSAPRSPLVNPVRGSSRRSFQREPCSETPARSSSSSWNQGGHTGKGWGQGLPPQHPLQHPLQHRPRAVTFPGTRKALVPSTRVGAGHRGELRSAPSQASEPPSGPSSLLPSPRETREACFPHQGPEQDGVRAAPEPAGSVTATELTEGSERLWHKELQTCSYMVFRLGI